MRAQPLPDTAQGGQFNFNRCRRNSRRPPAEWGTAGSRAGPRNTILQARAREPSPRYSDKPPEPEASPSARRAQPQAP